MKYRIVIQKKELNKFTVAVNTEFDGTILDSIVSNAPVFTTIAYVYGLLSLYENQIEIHPNCTNLWQEIQKGK